MKGEDDPCKYTLPFQFQDENKDCLSEISFAAFEAELKQIGTEKAPQFQSSSKTQDDTEETASFTQMLKACVSATTPIFSEISADMCAMNKNQKVPLPPLYPGDVIKYACAKQAARI